MSVVTSNPFIKSKTAILSGQRRGKKKKKKKERVIRIEGIVKESSILKPRHPVEMRSDIPAFIYLISKRPNFWLRSDSEQR